MAKALAQSNSLHTLDMNENNLGEHGPAVAEALAQSNSLVYTNLGVKKELQTKINILTQANKDNLLVLSATLLEIHNISPDNESANQKMFDIRLTVEEWELLKHCDFSIFSDSLSPGDISRLPKLVKKYFVKYAFPIMGVCKSLDVNDTTSKAFFIGDLLPEVLELVNSFTSPVDYMPEEQASIDILGDAAPSS